MRNWSRKLVTDFHSMPARWNAKVGVTERKNRMVQGILERLDHGEDREYMTAAQNFAKARFLTNFLCGGRHSSTYEM